MATQTTPQKRFFFPQPARSEQKRLFFPLPTPQTGSEKTTAFITEGLRKPHKLVKKIKALVLAQA